MESVIGTTAKRAGRSISARRPGGPLLDCASPDFGSAGSDQASSRLSQTETALAATRQELLHAKSQIRALVKRDLRLTQRFLRLAQDAALVRRVAYHEELTGLLSRSLLLDRFKQAVAQAARKGRQIALLFLDLDRFKNVNDTLAHAAGDDVLRQVAGRLAAGIRACDTACRYGGDEFVIMLPEANGRESTAAAAETIRSLLAAPYAVEAGRLTLTASIGTAVYPVDGRKLNDLARRCDIGMYRAKARLGTPLQHQPPDSGPTGNAAPAEQSRCTKQPDGASRQSRPRGEAHAIESWEGEGGAVF